MKQAKALPLTIPNAAHRSTMAFHRQLYMLMANFTNSRVHQQA